MVANCPSMPGRTQRILINKRQGASATKAAARLYKKPFQTAGREASTFSASGSSSVFSSFIDTSQNKAKQSFGSKDLRFDGKLELKEYFNRDPGPGTYSENASTVESSLMFQMERAKGLDGQAYEKKFGTKQKRFEIMPENLQCDPKI